MSDVSFVRTEMLPELRLKYVPAIPETPDGLRSPRGRACGRQHALGSSKVRHDDVWPETPTVSDMLNGA